MIWLAHYASSCMVADRKHFCFWKVVSVTYTHDIAFWESSLASTCRGSLDIGMACFIACHCRAQRRGRLQESGNTHLDNLYSSVRRVNLSKPAATFLDNRHDDIRSNENRYHEYSSHIDSVESVETSSDVSSTILDWCSASHWCTAGLPVGLRTYLHYPIDLQVVSVRVSVCVYMYCDKVVNVPVSMLHWVMRTCVGNWHWLVEDQWQM
jgi:hypothetical protein